MHTPEKKWVSAYVMSPEEKAAYIAKRAHLDEAAIDAFYERERRRATANYKAEQADRRKQKQEREHLLNEQKDAA